MVANHVERFVGREEELDKSRSYICSGCHHVTSLIIHGEHATGKAALGSKIFQEVRSADTWMNYFQDNFFIVPIIRRFNIYLFNNSIKLTLHRRHYATVIMYVIIIFSRKIGF